MEIWSFSGGGGEGERKPPFPKFVQNPLNSYKSQWRTRWGGEEVRGKCATYVPPSPFSYRGGGKPPSEGRRRTPAPLLSRVLNLARMEYIFPEHLLFYLEDARWILDNRERSFPSNQIKVLIPLLSDVYDSNFNPCSFSLKKREREESVIFKNFVQ